MRLLYHFDYAVGRFISLERLFEESKETYYETLEASSQGWHDGQHDSMPWLNYFWGVLPSGLGDDVAVYVIIVAIALSDWVQYARTVRGAVMDEKQMTRAVPRTAMLFRSGSSERYSGVSGSSAGKSLGKT